MFDPDLMQHIIKLHLEEGRTQKSLAEEYGISNSMVHDAVKKYRTAAAADAAKAEKLRMMESNAKLKRENEELKKEVDFLKKAAAFFVKNQG